MGGGVTGGCFLQPQAQVCEVGLVQDKPLAYGKKQRFHFFSISSFKNFNFCGYTIYKPSNKVSMVFK